MNYFFYIIGYGFMAGITYAFYCILVERGFIDGTTDRSTPIGPLSALFWPFFLPMWTAMCLVLEGKKLLYKQFT